MSFLSPLASASLHLLFASASRFPGSTKSSAASALSLRTQRLGLRSRPGAPAAPRHDAIDESVEAGGDAPPVVAAHGAGAGYPVHREQLGAREKPIETADEVVLGAVQARVVETRRQESGVGEP